MATDLKFNCLNRGFGFPMLPFLFKMHPSPLNHINAEENFGVKLGVCT